MGDPPVRWGGALEDRGPVQTPEASGGLAPHQRQDRRREVGDQRRRVDGRGLDAAGPDQRHRNPQRGLVQVPAMAPVAVLAEALAVVRSEDDQRLLVLRL